MVMRGTGSPGGYRGFTAYLDCHVARGLAPRNDSWGRVVGSSLDCRVARELAPRNDGGGRIAGGVVRGAQGWTRGAARNEMFVRIE
jgi:hypothetical protein